MELYFKRYNFLKFLGIFSKNSELFMNLIRFILNSNEYKIIFILCANMAADVTRTKKHLAT